MCGVPEGILKRAREVIAAQQEGGVLSARSQGAASSANGKRCLALVKRLKELDLTAEDWRQAATALLAAASAE